MKLKTETKSALNQKRGKFRRVLLVILILCWSVSGYGQNRSFTFTNTPLSEALKQVSETLNISVSFDAKAMSAHQVSGTFSGQTPEDILVNLLRNSGYKADRKYGNYLIVPDNQAKPTAAISYIDVTGLLTDRLTGEQLPYATIFLPERNTYLSSSVNGTFTFKIPAAQPVRLNIQYLGYQSIDSVISVSGSPVVLTFRMKLKEMELAPIQVRKERMKMIDQNKDASHSTVNPVGFANLPNMGESDVFRIIQLLPGVGYAEGSSSLSIRGGTADQNLVLFDGFTLYNLDHFFGTFSSVNPSVVKDIQIFKGGFDSRYGERISGIVDITGKTGNKFKPKINAGVNLISGSLEAELPISKKLTLVMAGRRSYADIYTTYLVRDMMENRVEDVNTATESSSIMQLQPGYYFYDYNGKLTFSKSEQEKMSVSVFGGKDFLSSTGDGRSKQTYSSTTDKNNWNNYGFSFSWTKQWHKRIFSDFQVGYSGYGNKYENETTVNSKVRSKKVVLGVFNSYEKNELNDFSVGLKNQFTINLKNSVDFGFQGKYNEYTYLKNEGADAYYSDIANSSMLSSAYIQFNTQQIRNLTLKLGGRVSHYNLSGGIYYEPRVSGNYQIGNFLRLKFATGKYYQFLSKVAPTQSYGYNRDFWVISDGANHPVLSANHLVGGINLTIKRFSFDAEAYHRTSNNLQMFLYIPPYQNNADPASFKNQGQAKKLLPSKFITGTGEAVGVDFLVKYESPVFTSWVSYSRSKSIRNFSDINQGADLPAPGDKTHELKWTNLLSWRKWNLSTLWVYSTGQPYVTGQTVDKTLTARFTYDRLPDFKRLDISANYNIRIRKVQVKLGASLINCLNQRNYNDIYSRDFNFDTTYFNETTYVRALGMTPNFYLNFQY